MNRTIIAIVLVPLVAIASGCATFSTHRVNETASVKVEVAQNLLQENKYANAISEFRKIIQEHPNTEWAAKAKYGIALAYVSANNPKKDYSLAVAEFDEFLAQYPQDERIPEARSWRHALKVLLDMKKENDRLTKNIEQLKQLDVRQEEKRRGK